MRAQKITNEECSMECESPECGTTTEPLFILHAKDGTGSMFLCYKCYMEYLTTVKEDEDEKRR